MTLDLSNPDHEAALVDACAISRSATSIKVIAANPSILDTRPLVAKALANLSSPASAAELIRQLVERQGVSGAEMLPLSFRNNYRAYTVFWTDQSPPCPIVREGDFLAIIARLLALAPKAGAEAVLRALRGEA